MFEVTQQNLDIYKNLYPLDSNIQALTVDALKAKAAEKPYDWSTITWEEIRESSVDETLLAENVPISITDCQMNIGYVVFDALCLALGAVGLRSTVSGTTIQAIFNAASPAVPAIEQAIARIGQAGATLTDKAKGVFSILSAIWSGGSLGAVFSAFLGSLTYWDAALYGLTGLATIVAAVATDGVAFVAQVVILLASFGFLVSDSVKAISACGITVSGTVAEGRMRSPLKSMQDTGFPGWTQVPNSGTVSFVTILSDGTLAGIGLDNTVYILEFINDVWTPIPNSGAITSLSEFSGLFIGTGTDNQLWYTLELGTAWTLADNSASVLCATFMLDGTILAVGTDQLLYTRAGLNDNWEQIPGSGSVTSVAVMPDGTLSGVGDDGQIYVRGDDPTTPWILVPNSGVIMSLAAWPGEAMVVGVGRDNLLYIASMMPE